MRRFVYLIINLILSGLVLWVSSKLFPEQIIIKDFSTLALATILLWFTVIAISTIGTLIMGGGVIFRSCGWAFFGIIILLGSRILALYALDAWLPDFNIDGFWLKVLIAVASSFAISDPKSPSNNTRNV